MVVWVSAGRDSVQIRPLISLALASRLHLHEGQPVNPAFHLIVGGVLLKTSNSTCL